MKKLLVMLLALAMALTLAACGEKDEPAPVEVDVNAKSEGTMTYAEYAAASTEYADVVVEGFVTNFAYAQAWGNVSLFMQDGDGAYYCYRMPCNDEQAASLKIGAKLKVTGQKSAWAGEDEIAEGTGVFEVLADEHVFEAVDVTADWANDDALLVKQNMLVAFKGVKVAVAPMYKWDGSGAQGDDIYVTFELDGVQKTFLVESDEFGADTELYKAVEALTEGAVVDLEGVLYWYNAPQTHITNVVVK